MLAILALVLILIVGYFASLYFNPYVTCTKCEGKPTLRGWVFSSSHHVCPKCQGTGQQMRFGNKLFKIEPRKPPS
jgi:DnaJ-class molecular chaperone